MELKILHGYYNAPDCFMKFGGQDTTIGQTVSEERKKAILEDFPDQFEEIPDVEAYKAEKKAVIAAASISNAIEVVEDSKEPEGGYNPFESDAMTSADAFQDETTQVQAKEAKKSGKK